MNGFRFTCLLVCAYLVAAVLFACERQWPKVAYFLGSAILTIGVAFM